MNRSPNQIALPFSSFRDQTPPSRSASSPAGRSEGNLNVMMDEDQIPGLALLG